GSSRIDGGDQLVAPGRERVSQVAGVLAPCLRERRPAPTAAADDRPELPDERHRVDLLRDGLVEVDDERDLALVGGRKDDRLRGLLAADAIGEVAQRASPCALDLGYIDRVLAVLPDQVGALLGLTRLLRLAPDALELG